MNALRFESYTLEPQLRELRRGDEVVALTRKAFDLLHFFAENAAAHPRSTRGNDRDGPILQGKLLVEAQKPREALTVLAPTRAFDGVDMDAVYLRGLANLQLKQLAEAELEFRKILDHPGIDPTAFQRPMAQLQLARVLTQEGDRAAAAAAYNTFLTAWSHADPGQPLFAAAQTELAALQKH